MRLDEGTTSTLISCIQGQGAGLNETNRLIAATLLKNKIKQIYGVCVLKDEFTEISELKMKFTHLTCSFIATLIFSLWWPQRQIGWGRRGSISFDRSASSGTASIEPSLVDGIISETICWSVSRDDFTHVKTLGADRVAQSNPGKISFNQITLLGAD